LGLPSRFWALLVPATQAADFFAIIDNFGKRPRSARLDVSVDSSAGGGGAPDVLYNVYDTHGTQLAEFFVTTNGYGFASSDTFSNLFTLSGGRPMLVRARTATNALDSGATLYIDSLGAPLTIGVLHSRKPDGTPFGAGMRFSVPLGNFRAASLLIANVGGGDAGVDIFKGVVGASGTGYIQNPRLGNNAIWRVDLTQNEASANVIVTSAGSLIIVQVVIDDGKSIQSYMVPPSQ
jgi:hypothetical protein